MFNKDDRLVILCRSYSEVNNVLTAFYNLDVSWIDGDCATDYTPELSCEGTLIIYNSKLHNSKALSHTLPSQHNSTPDELFLSSEEFLEYCEFDLTEATTDFDALIVGG